MKKDGSIKIPNQLQIGGTTFDIEYVDRTGGHNMGQTDYAATKITIAKNVDMSPASESSMQGHFFMNLFMRYLKKLVSIN
jgi:hypothetical protein